MKRNRVGRCLDRTPKFAGEALDLSSSHGFFASGGGPAIYCVGNDPKGRVVCLISRDEGDSWEDYARSEEHFHVCAIGGCREITEDGYIIGSFTDQHGDNGSTERSSKVVFFRIPAEPEAK